MRHLLLTTLVVLCIVLISCTSKNGSEQISEKEAKMGEQLFYSSGCDKCHSLKGESLYGPRLDSILNKEIVVIRKGEKTIVRADRKYITRSITHPEDVKLEGFSDKTMPQAFLSEEDIRKIVDFIVFINSESTKE